MSRPACAGHRPSDPTMVALHRSPRFFCALHRWFLIALRHCVKEVTDRRGRPLAADWRTSGARALPFAGVSLALTVTETGAGRGPEPDTLRVGELYERRDDDGALSTFA
jgi:hypothetical protein